MEDMDSKLNAMLNDPAAMARIIQMAQQLSGGAAQASPPPPPPPPKPGRPPEISFGKGILDALHLDDLDTGDLLLLFLLFFLFKQKADEELLIAIGLLLIL